MRWVFFGFHSRERIVHVRLAARAQIDWQTLVKGSSRRGSRRRRWRAAQPALDGVHGVNGQLPDLSGDVPHVKAKLRAEGAAIREVSAEPRRRQTEIHDFGGNQRDGRRLASRWGGG